MLWIEPGPGPTFFGSEVDNTKSRKSGWTGQVDKLEPRILKSRSFISFAGSSGIGAGFYSLFLSQNWSGLYLGSDWDGFFSLLT